MTHYIDPFDTHMDQNSAHAVFPLCCPFGTNLLVLVYDLQNGLRQPFFSSNTITFAATVILVLSFVTGIIVSSSCLRIPLGLTAMSP